MAKKKVNKHTNKKSAAKKKRRGAVYDGFEKLVLLIGLIFFNLVFVAWLFFTLAGGLIGLFATSIALSVSGFFIFIGGIIYPFAATSWVNVYLPLGGVSALAIILLGIALVSFGVALGIVTFHLSKYFVQGVIKWLALNYKIFKK